MIRWSERDELEELGRENPLSTPGVAWHAQSCPTLCDSVDCSPPGSFVHGTLQARILGNHTTNTSINNNNKFFCFINEFKRKKKLQFPKKKKRKHSPSEKGKVLSLQRFLTGYKLWTWVSNTHFWSRMWQRLKMLSSLWQAVLKGA